MKKFPMASYIENINQNFISAFICEISIIKLASSCSFKYTCGVPGWLNWLSVRPWLRYYLQVLGSRPQALHSLGSLLLPPPQLVLSLINKCKNIFQIYCNFPETIPLLLAVFPFLELEIPE